MNGAECGTCGEIQCVCGEIEKRKRIKEGKEALEVS